MSAQPGRCGVNNGVQTVLSFLRQQSLSLWWGKLWAFVVQHFVLAIYVLLSLTPVLLLVISVLTSDKVLLDGHHLNAAGSDFSLSSDMQPSVHTPVQARMLIYRALLLTLSSVLILLCLGGVFGWLLCERRWVAKRFLGTRIKRFFFALACMVLIRLGMAWLTEQGLRLHWLGDEAASVLVYVAQGLPLAVMIFAEFIRHIPRELKDAARCDGVSEMRIFFEVMLPLISPAVLTVLVFALVPIWNDVWSPLLLDASGHPSVSVRTVDSLGVHHSVNWMEVLSSLSLAVIPAITLYTLFARQLLVASPAGRRGR
jgi:raffinose/stachyose/melibiose transport system permease protein